MYIQDLTGDKDELLTEVFKSAKLHPNKTPTIELATRETGAVIKKWATEKLFKEITIDLLDAVVMYEINNGDYSDIPEDQSHARNDYESGMDDVVEAALEKYDEWLSADWLGRNTIDTKVWEDGSPVNPDERKNVTALATSAAKEVFKQLCADKTPAQVVSNAGIVRTDVETYLEAHLAKKENKTMADNATTLDDLIAKMKTYLGADFDQLGVFDDMQTVIEEDDAVLKNSAAGRLGLNEEDANALQIEAFMFEDPATEFVQKVDDYKIPSGRKKAAAKKKEKAEAKAQLAEGATSPDVLANLKECGAGDTAMAEALGVSRSTYTNYVKGKSDFSPNGDQYTTVREELVRRANLMMTALALLDGTEVQEIV